MATRELIIDGFTINDQSDCWVIAEIGHNHQGNVETCKQMFKAAKEAGCNAVKLQKRDNKSLFTKEAYNKPYESENSYGATYGLHREALEFNWDQYVELRNYARELGITFFSTAFDFNSADFLAKLEVPAFKMASGDLRNIPLLKHVAKFQRPMIISTGGGTMDDVKRAYDEITAINPRLCILQCTAGYPPKWEELDLKVINTFRENFKDVVIGLSSHDSGIAMAVAAYVLGARVIEKHFTLNRAMRGTDHAFSLEPQGISKMIRDLKRTRVALGDGQKKQWDSEKAPLTKMGKKLVAAKPLGVGAVLAETDFAIKSPGDGVPPYEISKLVGKRLRRPLAEDESIAFDALDI